MADTKIDLSKYKNHLGRKHQLIRLLWGITWALCASWLPRSVAKGWKNFLLRLFGAKIAKTAHCIVLQKCIILLSLRWANIHVLQVT